MGLFGKEKTNRTKDGFLLIEVRQLIHWQGPQGCIVSDRITKEGYKVGYMYRDEPTAGNPDSGWVFLAGNEDDAYMSDARNHHIFALNTVCNYDPDIIPYLDSEVGSAFIRVDHSTFEADDRSKPIFLDKQIRYSTN